MSLLLKIGAVALIYLLFSVILKTYRLEYVFLMRIFAVVMIFALMINEISDFVSSVLSIFTVFNIESEHINLLLKVTGIAVITDFVCDTLTDSGEKALSGVISIASRLIIIFMALPILNGLIMFCIEFVE